MTSPVRQRLEAGLVVGADQRKLERFAYKMRDPSQAGLFIERPPILAVTALSILFTLLHSTTSFV